MPTTRRMAREASVSITDDKENQTTLPLRKKPIRQAAARAGSVQPVQDVPSSADDGTDDPIASMPLSPKKVVQVSQTRNRLLRSGKAAVLHSPEAVTARHPAPRKITAAARRPQPRTRGQTQGPDSTNETIILNTDDQALEMGARAPINRETSKRGTAARGGRRQDPAAVISHAGSPSAVERKRATPHKGTRVTRVPKSKEVVGEDDNDHLAIARATSSLAPQNVQQDSDSSSDEICGPKTPFAIRSKSECEPDTEQKKSATRSAIRPSSKTPRSKMLVYRPQQDYFSHTQKVPLKQAPDTQSPRRPLSVSRGSSVAYVFHPLPKASRANSPLKGPYQWPVTPSDEREDPISDTASTTSSRRSRPTTPGLRRTPTTERNNEARDRLISLFVSVSDDEDDDESEDDEDDAKEPIRFPKLQSSHKDGQTADAEFQPEDDVQSEEDDVESDLDSNDIDQSIEDSRDCSTCESDISDIIDDSMDDSELMPELHSELMQSTPDQSAPELSRPQNDFSSDSEDELIGSPTLTRGNNWSAPTSRPAPRTRVSFVITDDETHGSVVTPEASRTINNLAFKTPRMRSALDEFDAVPQSGASIVEPVSTNRSQTCINPSLLSQCDATVQSPRKDSVQMDIPPPASPCKPIILNPADAFFPGIDSPEKANREPTTRLSFLINTEGLPESHEDASDLWLGTTDADISVSPDVAVSQHEITELDVDQSVIHNLEASPVARPTSLGEDLFGGAGQEPDQPAAHTPHYALPTASYDARRRSMPNTVVKTPSKEILNRGAETAVKPGAVLPFAQTWFDRQAKATRSPARRQSMMDLSSASISRSPSRRQSMMDLTSPVSGHQRHNSSLPRATSSLGLRGKSSLPQLRKDFSESAASTPVSATPRPRCYTPSVTFSNIKMGSSLASTPQSPPQVSVSASSPEKVVDAPSTKTPTRPTVTRSVGFTPHPSAPLQGVTAMVEIFTRSGLDASSSFVTALQRLGARTTKSFTDRVTHVVFKDGSPATSTKARLARKTGQMVHVVNSRWVTDCDAQSTRLSEEADDYAIDVDASTPTVAQASRRRKSMEPQSLTKESTGSGRKGSSSRLSITSSVWAESPIKGAAALEDLSLCDDDSWLDATPAPARQGERLVPPGSVPVNRIKKLDLGSMAARRLTAWEERD